MILFIAVCDTSRLEQMFGTFVRNICSTTPTSGSGPPGGTLPVGGHVPAAFRYHSKTTHAADKIERGGTEGEADWSGPIPIIAGLPRTPRRCPFTGRFLDTHVERIQ